MPISSSDFQNLARAVSAYSDEAYTLERKISSSGIMGSDARISGSDEDYFGTIRWYKPLGSTLQYDGADDTTGAATVINIGTQSTAEGATTSISTATAQYIKTVRTHGADQYNVQSVVSGQDGLAKIARDFGETRARDEDAALRAILNSVAVTECNTGSGSAAANNGGQESPDSILSTAGFFVDLNNNDTAAAQGRTSSDTSSFTLINTAAASAGRQVQPLLAAAAIAWKDYEPDFMYLVVTPSVYLDIRAANLIDTRGTVQDGNLPVETILNGKFRIIVSRGGFDSRAGSTFVQANSTQTSFLVLPGAVSMTDVNVPNPVAFDRDESMGRGTGVVEAWYRWGYIMHPRGYSWAGSTSGFAANVDATARASAGVVTGYYHNVSSNQRSVFTRQDDMLNLGILPICHS